MSNDLSNFYEVFYSAIKLVNADSAILFKKYIIDSGDINLELAFLGLESIDMFELVGKLEDEYRIKISDDEVFSVKTVYEMKELIKRYMGR